MNMKIFKCIVLMLALLGTVSCKNDDIDMSKIDFSNIEDLYAQPLPVIQKCVQGKWEWIDISRWGVLGYIQLSDTFVEINEDNVVVTQYSQNPANPSGTFLYTWEKKKTLGDKTTYVMWDNERKRNKWYFEKIQNDTLYVLYDDVSNSYIERYTFVKVK